MRGVRGVRGRCAMCEDVCCLRDFDFDHIQAKRQEAMMSELAQLARFQDDLLGSSRCAILMRLYFEYVRGVSFAFKNLDESGKSDESDNVAEHDDRDEQWDEQWDDADDADDGDDDEDYEDDEDDEDDYETDRASTPSSESSAQASQASQASRYGITSKNLLLHSRRKATRNDWTRDEDRFMCNFYKQHGPMWREMARAMATTLDHCVIRSDDALRNRFARISNTAPAIRRSTGSASIGSAPYKRSNWTAEEDGVIVELVRTRKGRFIWEEIGRKLGRTPHAVRNRAARLAMKHECST